MLITYGSSPVVVSFCSSCCTLLHALIALFVAINSNLLQAHGLSNVVSITHRDVCADGFPPTGDASNPDGVDAVCLDLPQPWLVIHSLTMVFRANCGEFQRAGGLVGFRCNSSIFP